jgi:hypothetical protein
MLKTFKYRLYPTKQQQRLLDQQLEEGDFSSARNIVRVGQHALAAA